MNARTFLRFPGFLPKAVTLSYDDGNIFDIPMRKIIDRYGIKCTFNICSNWLKDEDPNPNRRKMIKQEALDLYSDGVHEVACHGADHLSLAGVAPDMATTDLITDRIALEKMFGKVIKGMAYANGSCDAETAVILKNCGFEYGRTVNDTYSFEIPDDWIMLRPTCHHTDPRLMELAEKFVQPYKTNDYLWRRRPMLFYLWGHSYEFNDANNWEVLENFCKLVANREDTWYATNGEIVAYVKAYDSLRFSADGSLVQNPSCADVYLSYFGENIVVPAGKTVRLR